MLCRCRGGDPRFDVAEAEHRRILEEALRGPTRRSFVEVLASIPEVGRDEDFARVEDAQNAPHVLD